jgi:O-antigen/teichoic acid export membrane protein/ribosomal protein S18 acetylase RimI-like enzyme
MPGHSAADSPTAAEVEALLLSAQNDDSPGLPPRSACSNYAEKIVRTEKILGFREEGVLVAFLAFHCNDPENQVAYMTMLLVRSDCRRKGLATRLIQDSLRYLEHSGIRKFWLEVDRTNNNAIALYTRMKFEATGQGKERSLFMECSIPSHDAGSANKLKEQVTSLKANVIANYAGHIYMTGANLVMVPFYLSYMGAETYGLVGFFAMMQMWFQLLDVGLTPTMSRETSRFRGGGTDLLSLRRLMRALEGIFVASALLGVAAINAGADAISVHWLRVQSLPLSEVRNAVMLMALLTALRWICGLYRGVIIGLEKQIWLNGFNIVTTTLRAVLVVPFFILVGSSPTNFFSFQLAIAVLETVWLVRQTYSLLPADKSSPPLRLELAPLRGVLTFSLSVAFTSSVWVLITQTDKLVLSRMLPLAEYGYFTLAVLVAGGVMLISGPISIALQPRMTSIHASGDEDGLILLYRQGTQLVAVLCVPAALLLAFFPQQVLWAWTGNADVAASAAPVLSLYALGNGVLALCAIPYMLQFAFGKMRLHVIGGGLLTILLIPTLVWATAKYGATGAGYAWLFANLAYLLIWVPLIHRRFMPRLHLQWLATDICVITAPPLLGAYLLHAAVSMPQNRLALGFSLAGIGLVLLALAAAGSSHAREACADLWRRQLIGIAKEG